MLFNTFGKYSKHRSRLDFCIESSTIAGFLKILIHYKYSFNIHSIRNNINYALTNRNKNLSIKNFEKVFGYEYYEKNFEPKLFIEEISSVVKNKCYL